jgi:hypothetical protein
MRRTLVAAALGCVALLAWADEQAFTNRATELKERALPDAKALASLPENTSVKVLARSGQWTQVEAGGQTGWVRVFHLRFPATVSTSSSSSGSSLLAGATSLFGMGGPAKQQAANANVTCQKVSKPNKAIDIQRRMRRGIADAF